MNKLKPSKCAVILHDKDVNDVGKAKAPHIHIMVTFENARSLKNIAHLLGIEPQYIEQWKGESLNGYSYLIHATTNAEHQYQYSTDEVMANFDFDEVMEQARQGIQRVTKTTSAKDEIIIRAYLDELKKGSVALKEVEDALTGSQFAKAKPRLEHVARKRRDTLAEEWRKDMLETGRSIDVIYIYGHAGVGKSRLAKDYAEKSDSDYFLIGSSRDPFQQYDGQSTIILDELRPSTFPYNDLLKLLDPFNTYSNAPSRYFDKALTADLIIITSPYSPKEFYQRIIKSDKHFDERIDSYYQLARRLGLVIFLTKDFMQVAFFNESRQDFVLDNSSKEPNPYKEDTVNNILSQNQKAEKLYKGVLDTFPIADNSAKETSEEIANDQTTLFKTHTKLEVTKKMIKTDNKKSPIIKPTKANDDETTDN
ncbi:replication protein [Enterococcus sp. BWB1-3]|nr:replication protein [Enterococcus sp. BWB1-3]